MDLHLLATTIGSYLKLFYYLKAKLYRELNIWISHLTWKIKLKIPQPRFWQTLHDSAGLRCFNDFHILLHFLNLSIQRKPLQGLSWAIRHEKWGNFLSFFFCLIPYWKEFSKWLNLESPFNSYKTLGLCPHLTVHLLSCYPPEPFAAVYLSKS